MKVLLIDDDVALTAMLAEYLSGEGFDAMAINCMAEGIAAAIAGAGDIVLLDVMMPGGNGLDALREIRQASDVPVIMLTAKGSDTERVTGLELGADDYITKPYFAPELVARLRAVLRRRGGTGVQPPARLALASLVLDGARRRVVWGETMLDLTATEFNLIEALMLAGERVSSKEDLTLHVLGRRWQSYDRSIDVHISNLRQKVERATAEAVKIATVRGIGWRIEA